VARTPDAGESWQNGLGSQHGRLECSNKVAANAADLISPVHQRLRQFALTGQEADKAFYDSEWAERSLDDDGDTS
jgi:hypothetical protein